MLENSKFKIYATTGFANAELSISILQDLNFQLFLHRCDPHYTTHYETPYKTHYTTHYTAHHITYYIMSTTICDSWTM